MGDSHLDAVVHEQRSRNLLLVAALGLLLALSLCLDRSRRLQSRLLSLVPLIPLVGLPAMQKSSVNSIATPKYMAGKDAWYQLNPAACRAIWGLVLGNNLSVRLACIRSVIVEHLLNEVLR